MAFSLQAIKHLDLSFFIMLMGIIASGWNLYLYCYFGHAVTECFTGIDYYVFDTKWYNQPLSFQKNLIVVIQNAQQPIRFHGFGLAQVNLITYCKVWTLFFWIAQGYLWVFLSLQVLRTVISYYMMFKALTDG